MCKHFFAVITMLQCQAELKVMLMAASVSVASSYMLCTAAMFVGMQHQAAAAVLHRLTNVHCM